MVARPARWLLILLLVAAHLLAAPGLGAQTAPTAPPPEGALVFPETGYWLAGAFKTFWQRQGGVKQFGYPLSPPLRDSDGTTVQWLQRARLEYHADEPAGRRVLLGLLGREATEGRAGEDAFAPVPDPGDGAWFEATGHTLRGAFRDYWRANGGLAVYGYPISEEFEEVNPDDGQTYTVQYFQRNRFEYHPKERNPAYTVQLGLIGRQLYAGGGEVAPPVPDDAPPLPVVAQTRPVSATTPLRVQVAGDSFAPWLSFDLSSHGRRQSLISTSLDYKDASGLCLPSFFDWPARLTETMTGAAPPEVVVLFLGANDALIMRTADGPVIQGTAAWRAEYTQRAGAVMDIVGRRGGWVYWVGLPIMRDEWRRDMAAEVNAAVRAAAATRPWVRYIDTWSMFTDADGAYTDYRPDPDGTPTLVRQADGVHLTRTGTDWVAARVYADVARNWGFDGQ